MIKKIVPKAELHVHIEGTMSPELARKLAKKNNIAIPDERLGDDQYYSDDFLDFIKAYDEVAAVIKTPEDYYEVVYDYLKTLSKTNTLYSELIHSPDHAKMNGVPSYTAQIEALEAAINQARDDFGIETRLLIVGVRNMGAKACENVLKQVEKFPHEYVVGYQLAGDEVNFPPKDFKRAFEIADNMGLHCTAHAGEWCGPESVKQAIDHLPIKRIGHGVRAVEDSDLVDELLDRNIALEVCPTSNLATGVYKTYDDHSFREFFDRGFLVSLNSDDPPFFNTSLENEYDVAKTHFGFSDEELTEVTRRAIKAAFCDEDTKKQLLAKLG